LNYKYLLEEQQGNISVLRLNKPEVRNALVMEMRLELLHALEKAENNDQIKCIILTGEGKAFSAGGDS
jgi:2-(1,2-epoxy-1,2-dihydrophenyl)acetyl-CoA isomerase